MANFENRNRDSAKNDPNRSQEKDKLAPGQEKGTGQRENEGSEPRQGQSRRPDQEYPGEGVGQHSPSSGQQTGGNAPSEEDSDNDETE